MRQDRRHARSYIVASEQSGMAHADSGDVGDRVVFARGQNADDDAQVTGARTGSLSSRLAHCFKGEKRKANAEGQKRARWAQPLSFFGLHRFHFVFPGNAVEDSNSGIGTKSIDAASNRIIHQLCGFPHHGDGAITLAVFAPMITISNSPKLIERLRDFAMRSLRPPAIIAALLTIATSIQPAPLSQTATKPSRPK